MYLIREGGIQNLHVEALVNWPCGAVIFSR